VYLDRHVLINGRFDPGWLERGDAIGVEQLARLAFVLANDSCPLSNILTPIVVVSILFCLAWSE
jgi:hypothetical protein